jgi:hypothetical protein
MENDLIKTITFDLNGQARGSLIFSYLQDIDQLANQFTEPAISADSQPATQQSPGIKWLILRARGDLGK